MNTCTPTSAFKNQPNERIMVMLIYDGCGVIVALNVREFFEDQSR